MAKNNKSNKIKAVIIILIAAAIAAVGAFFFINNKNADEEAQSASSTELLSESQAAGSQVPASQPKTEEAESSTKSAESTSAPTAKQAEGYALPITVNEALDALYEHYGNGFDINRTIEEDGMNYFAVYRNGEKYASVEVDLSTGKATETITETGTKTNFNLV